MWFQELLLHLSYPDILILRHVSRLFYRAVRTVMRNYAFWREYYRQHSIAMPEVIDSPFAYEVNLANHLLSSEYPPVMTETIICLAQPRYYWIPRTSLLLEYMAFIARFLGWSETDICEKIKPYDPFLPPKRLGYDNVIDFAYDNPSSLRKAIYDLLVALRRSNLALVIDRDVLIAVIPYSMRDVVTPYEFWSACDYHYLPAEFSGKYISIGVNDSPLYSISSVVSVLASVDIDIDVIFDYYNIMIAAFGVDRENPHLIVLNNLVVRLYRTTKVVSLHAIEVMRRILDMLVNSRRYPSNFPDLGLTYRILNRIVQGIAVPDPDHAEQIIAAENEILQRLAKYVNYG